MVSRAQGLESSQCLKYTKTEIPNPKHQMKGFQVSGVRKKETWQLKPKHKNLKPLVPQSTI
jgi:hypothetical protein